MTRVTGLPPLLKRLQPEAMAATLPERIALTCGVQLDYASFLEILSGKINLRAYRCMKPRVRNAGFEKS